MNSIDIHKHGFYLALGGIVLVYIFVYLAFINPAGKAIEKQSRILNGKKNQVQEYLNKKEGLPKEKVIQYHKQQKEKLEASLQEALNFFKEKDQAIEKWFDDIQKSLDKSGSKIPELDYFHAVYAREKARLVQSYATKTQGLKIIKNKKDELGGDLDLDLKNKEKEVESILPLSTNREIVSNAQIKKAQKQFWLIQNFLDILEKGKLKTLTKYQFTNAGQEAGDELFVTRSIEIVGQMNYEDISLLLQTILNNPDFLVTGITYLSIKRDTTYKPEPILIDVKWGQTEEVANEEYMKKKPEKLPFVEITLRWDVLDYQNK